MIPSRRSLRRAGFAAVVAIALLSSACSMLFMRRPPRAEGPVAPRDCTRGIAAPVLDGVIGLGHLGQAAAIWGESRADFDTHEDYDRFRLGSAVIAGAFAVSAAHGWRWSAECRRRATLGEQALRAHLRTLAAQRKEAGG